MSHLPTKGGIGKVQKSMLGTVGHGAYRYAQCNL